MSSSRPDPGALAAVRQEIESIDRSIALLIAARLDAALRALRLRNGTGASVTDHGQERRVLDRGRRWADELGIPPRMLEELYRALVEEGKARFVLGPPTPSTPVVTVLVAAPRSAPGDLESGPAPELVAVPSTR